MANGGLKLVQAELIGRGGAHQGDLIDGDAFTDSHRARLWLRAVQHFAPDPRLFGGSDRLSLSLGGAAGRMLLDRDDATPDPTVPRTCQTLPRLR